MTVRVVMSTPPARERAVWSSGPLPDGWSYVGPRDFEQGFVFQRHDGRRVTLFPSGPLGLERHDTAYEWIVRKLLEEDRWYPVGGADDA